MVQHRIGGMRDESENGSGMRDDRHFNGGMRDKSTSAGAGFAHLDRQDAG